MKKNNELKNAGSVGEIKKQIADIGAMLPGKIVSDSAVFSKIQQFRNFNFMI